VLGKTRNIPANSVLQEQGIAYEGASEDVKQALQTFSELVADFSPIAFELQGYANNRAIFNATPARLTQAIVGELTLDEALERLDQDIAEAVSASR
jgi:alpha-1,4-digalacturonate transport system substrate-binding protein